MEIKLVRKQITYFIGIYPVRNTTEQVREMGEKRISKKTTG